MGGLGWGRHVNSRTFHFNVWQNSLQIKKKKRKNKKHKTNKQKKWSHRTSLAVQRLRLCISTAESVGSIPGRGPKTLHAVWCGQKSLKKKEGKKKRCHKWSITEWDFCPKKEAKLDGEKTQKIGVSAWERVLRIPRVMVRADPGSCAQTWGCRGQIRAD